MINSILIITNEKTFTQNTKDKILQIVDLIISSGKEVHIFKEDLLLYDLLRYNDKVFTINGLSSGADLLLFNRINDGVYTSEDKVNKSNLNFEEIYKKAISRNISPDRSKAYDETEYKTLRESIMMRRLKFSISKISNEYKFVINFKDSKDVNLLNSLVPSYGDGKFIYNYDCLKDKSDFLVGGCSLPESNFEFCIKEI